MLDLGCGPGRHLAALRAAGKRRARRRPLPRRGAARPPARRRRGPRRRVRHRPVGRAAGARRCCWTATSGSAARRRCCCGARASCSPRRPGARRARPAGRADAAHARAARGPRRGHRVVRVGARRHRRRSRRSPRTPAWPSTRRCAPAAAGSPGCGGHEAPPLPRWRSPLRGPWLTAALGSVLLVLVTIVAVTGFLSHVAYEPDLRGNAIVPRGSDLPLTFGWPTGPAWLYALNQGLHVNVGLVAVPFLLAKLWSVIPRLFVWPPVASPAQAIERLSIALLVSSAVFQFVTGIMNVQYWYAFHFNFVVAHYYGAVVFVGLAGAARGRQDAGDRARVPRSAAGCGRCATTCCTRGRSRSRSRRPRGGRPRPADDQPPRPVRVRRAARRRCCWSPTSARRSAGRCARWPSSRRGARTSRSTRPPRGPA